MLRLHVYWTVTFVDVCKRENENNHVEFELPRATTIDNNNITLSSSNNINNNTSNYTNSKQHQQLGAHHGNNGTSNSFYLT